MVHRTVLVRTLVPFGLVVVVLVLTMIMVTLVQAQVPTASVTISKEGPQAVRSGSAPNFTISVENTGDVTFTSVAVTDPLAPNCTKSLGELAPDASTTYPCAGPEVTEDFTNAATATAALQGGGFVAHSDTALVFVINPSVEMDKTADPSLVRVDDTVNYTITVENTGDSDLTDVTVDDTNCTLSGPHGDDGDLVLEQGEMWTYTCSVTAGSEDIVNTADFSATDEAGGTVSSSAQAEVSIIHPGVEMDKMAAPLAVRVGDTVNYTITVENTGDSDLTDVTVEDPNCILSGPYGDDGDLRFEEGEIWTYTCSVTASGEHIVNTATFRGYDRTGGQVDGMAQAEVDVIHPSIEIAKTPDTQMVSSSSAVTFSIAVTNSGDVALTAVTVSDVRAPNCSRGLGTLEAEDSASYECALANVTDGLVNSAEVIGTSQPGGHQVTDADAAKVRLDATGPCPADMIAYWKLEELGGSYDDFYYGHDGECVSTCPSRVVGRYGYGQSFNGLDTGMDVPAVPGDDSFDWGEHDSFSIEFWMKADAAKSCAQSNEVIVGRDDASSTLHWWTGIRCGTGGQALFHLGDNRGLGDRKSVMGTTVLTDGLWHHVVSVRDADVDEIRVFVDGREEGSESADYSDGFESLEMAALNIGWLNPSPFYHFAGIVDEVALYDRALSSYEIRQHYNEGLAGLWYCHTGPLPPVIVSTPVTEAASGRPYIYDVEAVGKPVPTYTLVANPEGMSIDPDTGLISWIPTVAQEGKSHEVEVQAINSIDSVSQSFTVVVHEGTICPTGMVAYWKLDESGGAPYYDFYYGHDGVCADQCPTPTVGYIDGGQEFDGDHTGIDVPAHDAFNWSQTDSFSIEFWMRADTARSCSSNNEVIVGRDDALNSSLHWWVGIGCPAGGQAKFYAVDTSWGNAVVSGTTVLTDGLWHHVVAVRDADADEVRLYVDGTEEDSEPTSYSAGFESQTAALNIGWLDIGGGYHFAGTLDEVAVYGKALSAAEVQQHYNNGVPGPGYCINPRVSIKKTSNSVIVDVGDEVTYTYVVTNTGDDSLSGVNVSDDKCGIADFVGGDADLNGAFDPHEVWTFTCSMPLTATTINIGTATGIDSAGGPVAARATAVVEVQETAFTYLPMVLRGY